MKSEIMLSPMQEINGEWFNTEFPLERTCFERGKHRWGRDKFADEVGVQGYHTCLDCYRCEFL